MTEITPEALEALSADTVFTLENIALAEWLWANLPVGPVKFHDKPTYEKALICHTVSRLAQALRTGQLSPSGDVVEAVALAILNSDRGMRGLDPLESRENVPDSDGYVTNATAAITTYEAVSGVVNTIALQEVTQIATYLWRKHYRDDAPDWRPLPDLRGVISQIDNMVTGLTRASAALGEKP